ncbi:unnamed protein product [Prunus armeniaca]
MTGAQEDSIMVTQRQKGPQNSIDGSSQNKSSRSHPEKKCTHCGGDKHTRDGCYELIGYLDWWDHSKAHSKNMSKSLNTSSESDLVSPMISATPAPTSAFIATTSGTDHMTFDHGQIASHTPSPQSVVSNVNGTPCPMIGEGSLSLPDSFNLDSMLIVPSLHHKLLHVAEITMVLDCTVTFWPTHCVFPDILSSKTIGYDTRRGELYYMDLAPDSEAKVGQAFKIGGASVEKQTNEGPTKIVTLAGAQ